MSKAISLDLEETIRHRGAMTAGVVNGLRYPVWLASLRDADFSMIFSRGIALLNRLANRCHRFAMEDAMQKDWKFGHE